MQRRDFVKGIAAASAVASTALAQKAPQKVPTPDVNQSGQPQGAMAVNPAEASSRAGRTNQSRFAQFHTPNIPTSVPDVAAMTDAHFFTPVQYATLEQLCEVLMPAMNGYPSAMNTGVPEFLDFLIGESPADRKEMYTSGLDRLNTDAMKQFHVPFSKVSLEQADTLIRPNLQAWMSDHPPRDPYKLFINMSHRDIRTATINSQAYSAAAVAAGDRAPGVGLYTYQVEPTMRVYA
jgi:hypothetical protein